MHYISKKNRKQTCTFTHSSLRIPGSSTVTIFSSINVWQIGVLGSDAEQNATGTIQL